MISAIDLFNQETPYEIKNDENSNVVGDIEESDQVFTDDGKEVFMSDIDFLETLDTFMVKHGDSYPSFGRSVLTETVRDELTDKVKLRDFLQEHEAQILACYQKGLALDPDLKGPVGVHLIPNTDGYDDEVNVVGRNWHGGNKQNEASQVVDAALQDFFRNQNYSDILTLTQSYRFVMTFDLASGEASVRFDF